MTTRNIFNGSITTQNNTINTGSGAITVGSITTGSINIQSNLTTPVLTTRLITSPGPAPTIATAATIAPTAPITFVGPSNYPPITTIVPPYPISIYGGSITLIPTGNWPTNTGGNIAIETNTVPCKALIMTYDPTTSLWYPSYTY